MTIEQELIDIREQQAVNAMQIASNAEAITALTQRVDIMAQRVDDVIGRVDGVIQRFDLLSQRFDEHLGQAERDRAAIQANQEIMRAMLAQMTKGQAKK